MKTTTPLTREEYRERLLKYGWPLEELARRRWERCLEQGTNYRLEESDGAPSVIACDLPRE